MPGRKRSPSRSKRLVSLGFLKAQMLWHEPHTSEDVGPSMRAGLAMVVSGAPVRWSAKRRSGLRLRSTCSLPPLWQASQAMPKSATRESNTPLPSGRARPWVVWQLMQPLFQSPRS